METSTLTHHSKIALTSAASTRTAPVKLALFGVGRWGSHLLRHFLAHPQAELIAVSDPCSDRLQRASQQDSFRQQIFTTTDWQEAIALPEVEAVVIATPAATHYPMIRAALEQGHHVLAEKPLTLDYAEALELCDLAAMQQRQLVVDHTYLFHSAVQRGKRLIQQGDVGELRYGYAARTHLGPVRQDVDALWDLAIHDIAIFNHWLNAAPIEVQAQGTSWLQPFTRMHSNSFRLSDLVWVKLTYANGFQAVIHLCWSNPDKQRRLSLVGSEATLVFDEMAASPLTLLQGHLELQSGQPSEQFLPSCQQRQPIEIELTEPLHTVCSHFLTCVQQNQMSEQSAGWLGAELVKILAALTRSLQSNGQPVPID